MTILRPMRPGSFGAYVEASVAAYADDNVKAGRWAETDAIERSRTDFASLLPQGLATPDNFLFEILDREDGTVVGFAWMALERGHAQTTAYVYNIEIKAAHRRQGHAFRAPQALEAEAAAAGARSIGLNVFAFNTGAQALYRKLGYATTHCNMRKPLRPAAGD